MSDKHPQINMSIWNVLIYFFQTCLVSNIPHLISGMTIISSCQVKHLKVILDSSLLLTNHALMAWNLKSVTSSFPLWPSLSKPRFSLTWATKFNDWSFYSTYTPYIPFSNIPDRMMSTVSAHMMPQLKSKQFTMTNKALYELAIAYFSELFAHYALAIVAFCCCYFVNMLTHPHPRHFAFMLTLHSMLFLLSCSWPLLVNEISV